MDLKNPVTPAGTVEKAKIKSELLKSERDLSIYIPSGTKSRATLMRFSWCRYQQFAASRLPELAGYARRLLYQIGKPQ